MTSGSERFAVAPGTRVCVTSKSGAITVVGETRDDVVVEGARAVDLERSEGRAGALVAISTSSRVTVRCPEGADVSIGTLSGRVELRGRLGEARVTTRSSRIVVGAVARLDARTVSGRVDVDRCDGVCRVKTASGRIQVAASESVDLATISASIEASATHAARANTVSGSVELAVAADATVEAATVSAKVSVSVAASDDEHPSTRLRSVTGRIRSDLESAPDGTIAVRTVSGAITVHTR